MNNIFYKTMRRLVFALLMILTLSLNAQDLTVKFLGIPVDGTKSEMISKLKRKGYKWDYENECLKGFFNGEEVVILIHTYNDLVDRITVTTFTNPVTETQIKIKFNNLVHQFENNKKYFSASDSQYIEDNVDISYEMTVNNKQFEAAYHQIHTKDEMEEMRQWVVENYDVIISKLIELEEFEELGINSDEIINGDKKDNIDSILYLLETMHMMNNDVWFMISKLGYNQYYISIYYDNLNNRPNGDDL